MPSWVMRVLVVVGLMVMGSCSSPRPNVLLVTFDTARWDHMGYATGRAARTPMLDAVAARGTWFSTCLTAQPLTLPSHTSIMTGLYPFHHGVRNNGTYIVPDSTVTLAERLKEAGYQTHGIVSAYVLDSQFGLDQGFDAYDDDLSGGPKQKMFMFKEVKASQTAARAAGWLRADWKRDQPFFMWTHFFDPHADYEPPPEIAALFPGDPYSAEIYYADQELGRILKELDELKALDNTLIIFTSDHGDGLGEHGEKTHGLFIYESTMRVPLIFSGPGVPAKTRVDQVVRTVDIVPTVLEMLKLDGGAGLDGQSLRALWKGGRDERSAYLENIMTRQNFGWAELRGLRSDNIKVIQAPRPEAYAVPADPSELHNLLDGGASGPAEVEGLLERVKRLEAEDPLRQGAQAQASMDAETRRKLNALGYVWDTVGSESTGPLPDPKDRVRFWEAFQDAQQLVRQKRFADAQRSLTALLAQDPDNIIALNSLASTFRQMGDLTRSLELFQQIMNKDPRRESAYLGAASIHSERHEFEEGILLAQRVIEMQPENPEGYSSLGDIYLEQGRMEEAEVSFRKALQIDPHSPLAAAGLGNCLNRAGRIKEAAEVLSAAYRRDQTSHAVAYNLAVVSEKLNDLPAALALYKQAIRLDPDHSMTWNNLGSLMSRAGKKEEALKLIQKAHELDGDNIEATYNLGAMLLTLHRASDALPYLEQASTAKPDLIQAHIMRSRALEALNRSPEAIEVWRSLADRMPVAWLHIARLELRAGHSSAAKVALRQGIAQDGERFRAAVMKDSALNALLGQP